jgi:hypothetical protein
MDHQEEIIKGQSYPIRRLQVKLVDHKLNRLAEKVAGLDFNNLNYPQPQAPVAEDHHPLV